jgi:hypothetical protein
MVLIISFISCSSKKHPSYNSDSGLSALKQEKLDKYLLLDPEDTDYLVLTNELIHDFLQVSESSLRSKNSGHALKVSSVGVQLFPFRNDLLDLKKQSISTFKETTLRMLNSSTFKCTEVRKRVEYLKAFAPDEIIEHKSNQCEVDNLQTFDMDTILKKMKVVESKAFVQDEKKYSTVADKELESIIRRNNELPMMDALMASLNYLSSFQLSISDFKIDPDTQSEDKVILYADRVEKYFPAVGKVHPEVAILNTAITLGMGAYSFFEGYDEPNVYCSRLLKIFEVENTSTRIYCSSQADEFSVSTSQKILKYKDVIFNKNLLPHFVVMKVRGRTKTNQNIEKNFLFRTPVNGTKDNNGEGFNVGEIKRLFERKAGGNAQGSQLYPSTTCRLSEYCIYGSREFTTSLVDVSMSIDLKRTLQFNGQIWNDFLAFEKRRAANENSKYSTESKFVNEVNVEDLIDFKP